MSENYKKHGNLSIYTDNKAIHILAEDQDWSPQETKKQLLELGIIFHHGGVVPIRIIPRKCRAPLLQLGSEDDGHIMFERNTNDAIVFDVFWATALIKDLQMALKEYKKGVKSLNDYLS